MKKSLLITLVALLTFIISGFTAWAQTSTAESEFTLEEITVTAEKRAVSLQELPASVVAIEGIELAQQGKATTAQILESIPNVTYRGGSGTNPDGNITIRGVQRTQESGGTNAILPSTTATYTDGVYQGIGGGYDINRVEVLRGPQGTLYGRSATGGVVAFYTNDPKLSEFGGSASVEYGTASLFNIQGALNVPVGDKVALRVAGHYYARDGYFEAEGGKRSTKEGRVKALFQPNDALGIILSISAAETKENGGGWQAFLDDTDDPDSINYKYSQTVLSEGAPNKYRQAAVNVNYDLGTSTLTYIGGYHDFDSTGLGAESGMGNALHRDLTKWPTDYYHSEEIRWASDEDFPVEWATMLVGANYFKHRFDTSLFSVQTAWETDPDLPAGDADGMMAPIFGQVADGYILNYGLFTEETFKVQDNFRITAGLRYDKTKMDQVESYQSNTNLTAAGSSLWPATYATISLHDVANYNNFTYKLRFEYDLTPDNMLYFLTATGFMPGYTTISPVNSGPPDFITSFQVLELDQQKLTSYEFGSKNQFLDNTLRLNADVFYYDYEGYVESVNIATAGPPKFTTMPVPLEMYGVEVNGEYLITMYDKVAFDAGYVSVEITDRPVYTTVIPLAGTWDSKQYIALTELPGNADLTATINYEHTFTLADGSRLVPRAELRYKSGYYLSQMTQAEVTAGKKPYNYQKSNTLFNAGLTWTSASEMYSVAGYVRNVLDKEYKAGVGITSTPPSVTPGDPRTFGVVVNLKF